MIDDNDDDNSYLGSFLITNYWFYFIFSDHLHKPTVTASTVLFNTTNSTTYLPEERKKKRNEEGYELESQTRPKTLRHVDDVLGHM